MVVEQIHAAKDENMMSLIFMSLGHPAVTNQKNLAGNVDAYGKVDVLDNKYSYGGATHYLKAGIYNQCSTSNAKGMCYAGCGGTDDKEIDKANGYSVQATLSRLVTRESAAP